MPARPQHWAFKRLHLMLAILWMCLLLMPATAHMATDPISASMDITPGKLTSPGTVRVVINIMNVSDDNQVIPVTLLDPAGNVCASFGSGGTANLGPNVAQSYNGNWLVTQQQLESGRITYTARYTYVDENGLKSTTQSLISKAIQHNKVEAKLHVERHIDPGPKVQQGQTVTIRYIVKNIGTVDVSNIKFTDPTVISEPVEYPFLAVNETADVSYSVTAGAEAITTFAEVSFNFQVDEKTETSTLKLDSSATIEVLVPDLLIQLTGQQIVNKGDKVELTYVITNKSDLSYEQIRIYDELLGDVETNLSIKPQQTYNGTHSITVNDNATYKLILTGVDSTGESIIYQSNQLTIQTTEAIQDVTTVEVVPVVLGISIEADRPVIYEEPGDIIFRIKVTNNGVAAAENVAIKAVDTTLRTVDRIEPGQTIDFVKAFSASVGGQFQFTATAKDNTGTEHTFESNIVTVPYEYIPPLATAPPTPAPTATPEPAADPSQAPEDMPFGTPDEGGTSIGSILLYVLAGLFGVVIIAVGVLLFLDGRRGGQRRGSGQAKVIDSIERVPHRDYTRAPTAGKRGGNGGRKERQQEIPAGDAEATDGDVPEPQPRPRRQPDAAAQSEPAADPSSEARPMPSATAAGRTPDEGTEDGEKREGKARTYEPPKRSEPAAEAPDLSVYMPPAKREREAAREAMPAAEQLPPQEAEADAPAHRSEYLSRMRRETRAETPAESVEAEPASLEDTRPSPRVESRARRAGRDAEEEALLSGSTGQYRLSRRSASVRPEATDARPARTKQGRLDAEDPELFARKQRVARTSGADLTNFYDDDDEELTPPKRRR